MSEKIVNPVVQGLNDAARKSWKQTTKSELENRFEHRILSAVSNLASTNISNKKANSTDKNELDSLLMMKTGFEHEFKSKFETEISGTTEDCIAQCILELLELSANIGVNLEHHINARLAYKDTLKRLKNK